MCRRDVACCVITMANRFLSSWFICFFLLLFPLISCADEGENALPSIPDVPLKVDEGSGENEVPGKVVLRNSYRNLSAAQVQAIPHKSIRKWKKWGFYGSSTLKRDYEIKVIKGDKVVVERTTGLMWHQSGSKSHTNWGNAKKWIQDFNSNGYAGYKDWRLPTVDEAVSLLEPDRKSNSLYVDPVFDKNQLFIWTGDGFLAYSAWVVSFRSALTTWSDVKHRNFVRPVRAIP
ncbi:MAG: DUF1566 domain-containing protein [Planctomycetes bacterium]|nr:DUF1566 domain-containing protein [Planctomycetota bacterium]